MHQPYWNAAWCWLPGPASRDYSVAYFRLVFTAPAGATARLAVSADSRYRLYLNGELLGRGPCKSDLRHYRYETYELTDQLQSTNVLGAQVLYWGADGPWSEMHDRPAFVAQGQVTDSRGESVASFDTPGAWRVLADTAYRPLVPASFVVDPLEDVDGNVFPHGWLTPDYDDTHWLQPAGLGAAMPRGTCGDPYTQWRLKPRTIPQLMEKSRCFSRVLGADIEPALQDVLLGRGREVAILPAGSRIDVTLDHGTYTTAYPVVRLRGGRDSTLTLAYAEALTREGEKHQRDDAGFGRVEAPGDRYRAGGGDETYEPFHWRAFRFVRLRIDVGDEPLELFPLQLKATHYPFVEQARFASSQPLYDLFWDISWRTLLACAHETYEDCPYYEQQQYVGDTRIQALLSYVVSGDDRLARQALHQFDQSRQPDGITQSRYPSNHDQIIPPFSLLWVLMLEDHYRYYGDATLVRQLLPGVREVLRWFGAQAREDGLVGPLPWLNFVDWVPGWSIGGPPPAQDGPCTVINLMYYEALRAADRLADAIGDEHPLRYHNHADAIATTLQETCWNSNAGLFADAPHAPTLFSQHANAWAILTGVADDAQTRAIVQRLVGDETLAQATIYFTYYVLRALECANAYDQAFPLLNAREELLRLGLSTWPESPEPTRSDCHAWASYPMYEFLAVMLGIQPAAPGFARIRLAPHPGPLRFAEGIMPTVRGPVQVRWERRGAHMELQARTPQGTPVDVVLPDGTRETFADGGSLRVDSAG